jgi:hypothetical protein
MERMVLQGIPFGLEEMNGGAIPSDAFDLGIKILPGG